MRTTLIVTHNCLFCHIKEKREHERETAKENEEFYRKNELSAFLTF